jgi:HK97 family phage portal protein
MGIFTETWERIRSNHREVNTEYRSAMGGQVIPWTAGRPQWLPRTVESYDTHAYRKVALIFACIQYLSNATGKAPMRVYNPESREADDTHPLRQLIVQPNFNMGESRFFSFLAMNMAVTNFVVIEKERSRADGVINLWPLRSDWIRPIPRNGAPCDWEYHIPGSDPKILKAENAIPITYADTPDQSPTGIGPLTSVLREAQISSALTDFVKVFMDRGAIPLYMLIPSDDPKLVSQFSKPETKDAFMGQWRQKYGGLMNSSTDPLLSPGIKDIKRVGLDMNELAYTELNNLTDVRICQVFGVSPLLVDANAGMEGSTFSNKAEARRSFFEDTMSALWGRIDDAFTRHLLPDFEWRPGWDIQFDTGEIPALQDDRNEAWSRATTAWVAGVVSRHVAQKEMDVDLHGEDVFSMSYSQVLVPVAATVEGSVSVIPDPEPEDDEDDDELTRAIAPTSLRALPPIVDDGLIEPITEDDVEDAIDLFDETFPNYAGLLDADVTA